MTSQQAKLIERGDYAKLSSDIKSFKVTITGKCKTFIAALKGNATKIQNMVASLNAIEPKQREAFSNSSTSESDYGAEIRFDGGSGEAKLYASILLEDIPAKISGSSITLLCENGGARLAEKLKFKDVLQGKVKSFLPGESSYLRLLMTMPACPSTMYMIFQN